MKSFIKTFKNLYIRQNDLDSKDFITPTAILDYFQTVASLHAKTINASYEELKSKNFAWILAKQKYVIERNDKSCLYKIFDATTYPLKTKRIEYDRCYELKSKDDKLLIKGLSRWCIVDIESHNIVRKNIEMLSNGLDEGNELEFDKDLVRINNDALKDFIKTYDYLVKPSDIDHYSHMNNTKYGDVILNSIDTKFYIKEFEIIYTHECKLNDIIEVFIKEEDNIIYVIGKIKGTDLISFKAKLKIYE